MIYLEFNSKQYLNIEILTLIFTMGKTVIDGPYMINRATRVHWLKCELFDHMCNFVEEGPLLAASQDFLVLRRKCT